MCIHIVCLQTQKGKMMLIKNCYTEVIHIHHSYLENVGEYILLHNIIFDPNVQRKLLLTP